MMTQTELTTIIKRSSEGINLPCMIQPRSSQNKIVGLYGELLKIKLTAPPVDGKANAALIKYLSKVIDVPRGTMTITSGLTSRRKTVRFTGINIEDLINKIIEVVR
jgi:uncharacterized protein (TIGR00251 family)